MQEELLKAFFVILHLSPESLMIECLRLQDDHVDCVVITI